MTAITAVRDKAFELKTHCRKFFWAWIAYQTIKGTLTTSLIWLPLLYAWLH